MKKSFLLAAGCFIIMFSINGFAGQIEDILAQADTWINVFSFSE